MQGLTPKEEEKCKEIELKNQKEFLTGGYPKLVIKFYEKMIRANEYTDRMMESCERMETQIRDLLKEREALKGDLKELRDKYQKAERNRGKYARRQQEFIDDMPECFFIPMKRVKNISFELKNGGEE